MDDLNGQLSWEFRAEWWRTVQLKYDCASDSGSRGVNQVTNKLSRRANDKEQIPSIWLSNLYSYCGLLDEFPFLMVQLKFVTSLAPLFKQIAPCGGGTASSRNHNTIITTQYIKLAGNEPQNNVQLTRTGSSIYLLLEVTLLWPPTRTEFRWGHNQCRVKWA